MSALRIVAISAGARSPSSTRQLADELAHAVGDAVAGRGGAAEIEHVELRTLAHDLVDALTVGFPSPELEAAMRLVTGADALVVASPVFSASYSGLFKLFFDLIEPGSLDGMPMILAATGGTERHSLVTEHAMRPLFAYLRARPVQTSVFAATSDFGGEGARALGDRVRRAAGELADALSPDGPSRQAPPDPFDEVTPFEELLRAASR